MLLGIFIRIVKFKTLFLPKIILKSSSSIQTRIDLLTMNSELIMNPFIILINLKTILRIDREEFIGKEQRFIKKSY